MTDYLNVLAQTILSIKTKGISKVRFAKTIYFVQKNLISDRLASIKDLEFIRMPLGPVPVGFSSLEKNENIEVQIVETGLAYNMQVYSLRRRIHHKSDSIYRSIRNTIDNLEIYPTSTLVEVSHEEPSWIRHHNDERYFIESDDFSRVFPIGTKKRITQDEDNQLLQARLVEGMLSDIVEESTRLEYPDLQ